MDVYDQDLAAILEPGFSVQEALDIILRSNDDLSDFSDDSFDGVFITPPEPSVLTDEDSGDEDELIPDNLSRRQLLAQAEIVSKKKESIKKTVPLKSFSGKRKWLKGDLEENNFEFPSFNYNIYKSKSPVQLFEMFLDDEIINMLTEESRRYALYVNQPDPNILSNEIKCFVAILILSGYAQLPGKRFYWDSQPDMHHQLVVDSMRRNRFSQILRFFHCCDNSKIDLNDKLWKIRPLIEKVKSNCLKNFVPEKQLSYGECMVKYFGRHGCKQFIRGKPIRFGYKVWALNTVDGYLVNFEVYQGKSIITNTKYEKYFGKAASPLICMIDSFPKKYTSLPFSIYFDNLFTSFNLLSYLRERGIYGTGTIRQNRIPKDCTITRKGRKKSTKTKFPRGYFESTISKQDGAILVTWQDNSLVSALSNCHGVAPVTTVKRWSQKEKKFIQVPRPHIFAKYNKYMGGTDRMDQNIAKYRISIRNKKWYWPLLSWLVDVCVQNSWILHRKAGGTLAQLEFRRQIVLNYLSHYGVKAKGGGRPSTSSTSISCNRISDEIRYDGQNHLICKTPGNKKKRCAGEGCSSIMRTMCSKCNVGVCVECFVSFHTTF